MLFYKGSAVNLDLFLFYVLHRCVMCIICVIHIKPIYSPCRIERLPAPAVIYPLFLCDQLHHIAVESAFEAMPVRSVLGGQAVPACPAAVPTKRADKGRMPLHIFPRLGKVQLWVAVDILPCLISRHFFISLLFF